MSDIFLIILNNKHNIYNTIYYWSIIFCVAKKLNEGDENLMMALERSQLETSQELPENNNVLPTLSPVQVQQEYFENLPECDWVKYEFNNRKHLLQNVAFALYGSPSSEGDMFINNVENTNLEGYTSRQKENVMKIYEKICEQSKYAQNDTDIYLSVLLVVCAKPHPVPFYRIKPSDYWVDLHERNDIIMWYTAVFCVRKCIPTVVDAKPCKVFIDEDARVYHDWQSYLTNNRLPKCVIVAPENGEYRGVLVEGQDTCLVKLIVSPTPSLGLKARVLSSVDMASTAASLGAVGVLGVAAFTPVGPAVLIGATVATVATGIYGLVRSSLHLHDRRMHEQTISPTDAEARNSWLNIAASSVGLTAGAASTLLAKSAAAGTNVTKTGQALAASVEILRHANLLTGGAGVINSLVHIVLKYHKHGETPSTLELFQFSAATLFFCQAAFSNRTAQQIIEDAQASTINEYRSTLRSNRHRKIFDKINAETRRIQGTVLGNTEVIKGIKNIVNKDQFFADALKINKDINEYKLRISMTADGRVNLNAVHKFNPSDLYAMGSEGRSDLFASIGPAAISSRNVPTRVLPTSVANNCNNLEQEETGMLVGIHPGEIIRIGSLLLRVSASGAENIALLLENLSQEVHANLMTVAFNILNALLPNELGRLRLFSLEQDLVEQIVTFLFNYMKHNRPLGECRNTDNGIIVLLKEFFQDGRVKRDTILRYKEKLLEYIDSELDKRRNLYPNKVRAICEQCQGVRFVL